MDNRAEEGKSECPCGLNRGDTSRQVCTPVETFKVTSSHCDSGLRLVRLVSVIPGVFSAYAVKDTPMAQWFFRQQAGAH